MRRRGLRGVDPLYQEDNMTDDAGPHLYRVRWEIELEAETPQEAAGKARFYQTKPGTTATVFEAAETRPYADNAYRRPGAVARPRRTSYPPTPPRHARPG